MKSLLIITVISLVASLVFDRRKTLAGLRRALTMFLNILPSILTVLTLVSVVLNFLPPLAQQPPQDALAPQWLLTIFLVLIIFRCVAK